MNDDVFPLYLKGELVALEKLTRSLASCGVKFVVLGGSRVLPIPPGDRHSEQGYTAVAYVVTEKE